MKNKNAEVGKILTELQKYESDKEAEFVKNEKDLEKEYAKKEADISKKFKSFEEEQKTQYNIQIRYAETKAREDANRNAEKLDLDYEKKIEKANKQISKVKEVVAKNLV